MPCPAAGFMTGFFWRKWPRVLVRIDEVCWLPLNGSLQNPSWSSPLAVTRFMTGSTHTIGCWVLLLLSFCWQKILNSAALTIAWHGYSLIYTARCGLGLLQQAFHCPMCVYDRKNGSKFCYVRVVQGKVRGMVHELDMSFCQNSNEQAWLSVLLVMAAECVYNWQQKWSRML